MTLFRIAISILSLVLFTNPAVANCSIDSSLLGARYKVITVDKTDNSTTTRHIVLWRNGKQVAHEYTDARITEIWEQTSNNRLRVVRHFDDHMRGIEYQPNEIFIDQNAENWSLKYQFISNNLIQKMQLTEKTGDACETEKIYSLQNEALQIDLVWLDEQRLVKNYSETTPETTVTWQLEKIITEPEKVQKVFITRADYQTTDYADIGDNESDPFLMKMINLGFVEHGASGFYDEHGHALEGSHSH